MIRRIDALNNCGIFSAWHWPAALPEFSRCNVIYGWNGTGKTTLTRILATLEPSHNFEHLPLAEFAIIKEGNSRFDQTNCQEFGTNVRVFNSDFVRQNISWDAQEASPILGVGKESIELAEKLRTDEASLATLKAELDDKRTLQRTQQSTVESFLTKKAREIKDAIGFRNADAFYSNYDKAKLRQSLQTFPNTPDLQLPDTERLSLESILSSKLKSNLIAPISYHRPVMIGAAHNVTEGISSVSESDDIDSLGMLLKQTVQNRAVERWKDNPALNQWVGAGKALHTDLDSKDTCLFCGSPIGDDVWHQIEGHFSKEYALFLSDCDATLQKITRWNIKVTFPSAAELYEDLRIDYEAATISANAVIDQLNKLLLGITSAVQEKRLSPMIASTTNLDKLAIQELYQSLDSALTVVQSIVDRHNKRSSDFETEQSAAKTKLELHRISFFYQEYTDLLKALQTLELEVGNQGTLTAAFATLNASVNEMRARISDYGIRLEDFNNLLHQFLGRQEICLEMTQQGVGKLYRIQRNGQPAKNLSEGEKTAIAFIYFVTKLREHGFAIENGIVVIDDPISSLDSHFLHHAFSFLKTQVKDAKQLFILTHNFTFLRLILRWFQGRDQNTNEKNRIRKAKGEAQVAPPCGYYMLQTPFDRTLQIRRVAIERLDPFLLNHHSEYEYLYKVVRGYSQMEGASVKEFYSVPNLARKLLETFMAFRQPGNMELLSRLEREQYDPVIINRIFSFVNFHSHGGLDRGEGVDLSLLSETPKVIEEIFKFMKFSDPKHVDVMDALVAAGN